MIQQHHHYFLFEAISANTLDGEYNLALVFLSYLIATLAGLCAFSIVNLLPKLEANRVFLLLIGGVVLGLGVWGMHFTGMLAFSLPTEVRYDPEITLISTFPAIVCSIIFLENLTKKKLSQLRIAMVALALASGIGAMHFTGMMAMSMKAYMTHDLILYVLAILSSWALAVITIVIHKTKKSIFNRNQHAILCAMTFGFSVASMHYLAMLSTYFVEDSSLTVTGIGNEFITNSLVVFTIILMTLFLIVLFFQNKVGNLKQVAKLHHHRVTLTIDNMQDAFVLGDCSGNIILVNRIFTEVFGTEILSSNKQENSLKNLYDNLTNKVFEFDDEQQLEEVLVVLNDQSCIDVQLRLKDIHENWWLFRRSTTPTNEVIQTWTNISDQVSQELEIKKAKDAALKALEDLKNTQEELVETKKMASLGGLVTGVAHELNTPLGISITGLSSIKELAEEVQAHIDQGTLKKSELEDSIESIVEFEVLVAKNLERMNTLIQQFKYISVDQDIDCASTFKLVNVLTDVVSTKQSKIKEQKIDVIIDAPDVEITTFETALIQVVDSLLSNALEHAFNAHDDPRISMTLSQCDDELHLLIEDNGSGIPDALKATIFDPFVTSKRGSGGVGLGLYIAYNLVSQKLGGKIKLLEDNSDNLTRFLVILPLSIK